MVIKLPEAITIKPRWPESVALSLQRRQGAVYAKPNEAPGGDRRQNFPTDQVMKIYIYISNFCIVLLFLEIIVFLYMQLNLTFILVLLMLFLWGFFCYFTGFWAELHLFIRISWKLTLLYFILANSLLYSINTLYYYPTYHLWPLADCTNVFI